MLTSICYQKLRSLHYTSQRDADNITQEDRV